VSGDVVLNVLGAIALATVLLAANVGLARLSARMRKGRFEPAAHLPGHFAFWSDFGLVDFDREQGHLRIARNAGERVVPLAELAGAQVSTHDERAAWWEEGTDPDLLGRHRDRIVWHTVALRLASGEKLPVYTVGQLRRIEFLTGPIIDWQWKILRRIGWIPDVEREARTVLAKVAAQVPARTAMAST
jgi:hypothetical protein